MRRSHLVPLATCVLVLSSVLASGFLLVPRDTWAGRYELPPGFPPIEVTFSDNPDPGYLFVCSWDRNDPGADSYIMILDNTGDPVFFKKTPGVARDFMVQPNGLLTYSVQGPSPSPGVIESIYYAMDATFTVVDSFECANGLPTSFYDLHILDNDHVVLISHDPRQVDMSQLVEGGNPEATVIGAVIQELDADRKVVFEWASWDHFEITDAVREDLTASLVRAVHANSIDVDPNGDFIVSCRFLNEVTKISRETGEILWRLGGKNNQFLFVNGTRRFSYQHAARILPNGNLTLFDNGNHRSPSYSRAVEYELDEENMTATLVWQYRNTPDIFGNILGYVQRLPSGNTLICWGGTTPTLTEVRPDGSRTLELTMPALVFSYRAYRFPSIGVAAVPDLWLLRYYETVRLGFARFGAEDVKEYRIHRGDAPGTSDKVYTTTANTIDIGGLTNGKTYYFRVTAVDNESNETPFSNELAIVPQGMTAVESPEGLVATRFELLPNTPNPFNPSTVIRYTLPSNEWVTLAVYDLMGQRVALLANQRQEAGFHEVLFENPGLASGVYLTRLQAGGLSDERKLIVLK